VDVDGSPLPEGGGIKATMQTTTAINNRKKDIPR
jgi:hypothetical protein